MTLFDAPIPKRYTPQDLLAMPDNNGLELVDGRIVEKNVSKDSSRVEGIILARIASFLAEHPIAEVYPSSLGYVCFPDDPDRMRKPDVSVVTAERLKSIAGDVGYMPIVPDLAIEVVSSNDVAYEIEEKVDEYLRAAFPLVWVAYPHSRTITVYPLSGRPTIYTSDDEITAEAALPGFRCNVRDFFPPTPAKV
jgi:Uma2 family endonuclease